MLGHHQPASKTPFKWRFAGVLMMLRVVFGSSHPSSTKKKNFVKVGPPLTKSYGSAHDGGCYDLLDYGVSYESR